MELRLSRYAFEKGQAQIFRFQCAQPISEKCIAPFVGVLYGFAHISLKPFKYARKKGACVASPQTWLVRHKRMSTCLGLSMVKHPFANVVDRTSASQQEAIECLLNLNSFLRSFPRNLPNYRTFSGCYKNKCTKRAETSNTFYFMLQKTKFACTRHKTERN